MRKLLLALTFAASIQAAAQTPELKYDPSSPAALAAKAKYAGYEQDGQALRTSDLYAELRRMDAAKKFRLAKANKPEEILAEIWSLTDEDMRAISYATVLQKRGEGGDDPYASFFYGVRQWDTCQQLQRQTGAGWADQAKECWISVMSALRKASEAQIADASFNLARMYESGFGVTPSKLAAAEWYVKAADQYNARKSREEALTSVESALNLVPDHPAALRLRRSMLR